MDRLNKVTQEEQKVNEQLRLELGEYQTNAASVAEAAKFVSVNENYNSLTEVELETKGPNMLEYVELIANLEVKLKQ